MITLFSPDLREEKILFRVPEQKIMIVTLLDM